MPFVVRREIERGDLELELGLVRFERTLQRLEQFGAIEDARDDFRHDRVGGKHGIGRLGVILPGGNRAEGYFA